MGARRDRSRWVGRNIRSARRRPGRRRVPRRRWLQLPLMYIVSSCAGSGGSQSGGAGRGAEGGDRPSSRRPHAAPEVVSVGDDSESQPRLEQVERGGAAVAVEGCASLIQTAVTGVSPTSEPPHRDSEPTEAATARGSAPGQGSAAAVNPRASPRDRQRGRSSAVHARTRATARCCPSISSRR